MTNELVNKQETGMTVADQLAELEGMLGQIDPTDILVPKLLLQQSTSKLVHADKADPGDFADSVSGEILGSAREKAFKPVNVVPLKFKKVWEHYVKGEDKKFKYKGVEDWCAKNSDLPRFDEYEKDGQTWRSDSALYFYVLVLDSEGSDRPLPYLVAFRRTNYKSGQKLINHFALCLEVLKKHGKVVYPYATSFQLSAQKQTNDEGTWWTWDIGQASKSSESVQASARSWLERLSKGSHRVDESDIATVEEDTSESVEF